MGQINRTTVLQMIFVPFAAGFQGDRRLANAFPGSFWSNTSR
jgi:hypothetical protein